MFTQAVHWALTCDMTGATGAPAKHVLLILAVHENEERGDSFPGTALIQRETGMAEATILKALKALEAAGVIRHIGFRGLTRIWRLRFREKLVASDPQKSEGVAVVDNPQKRKGVAVTGNISNPPTFSVEPPNFSTETPKKTRDRTENSLNGSEAQAPPLTKASKAESAHPNAQAKTKGSRLPDDWKVPDAWCVWASQTRPDLAIDAIAARFVDHWRSQPGSKAIKADWQATWRNWVKNERQGHAPYAAATALRSPVLNADHLF